MMVIIALLAVLNAQTQSLPREPSDAWYRRHLPATIKVTQDVDVKPYPAKGKRGTLEIGHDLKGFTIKKGQTFQMIKVLGEGECQIRVQKKEYELGSCPWLEGFTDRQTDIFQFVPNK